MKQSIQRLVLIAALCPAAALASDISYNYVEGGVAFYSDASEFDQDFVGFDTRLSASLTPEVFVFGGLKYLSDDLDYTAIHVGAGFQHGLNRQTSLWGGVTMEYQDYDLSGVGSVDDTALGLRGGLRHQLNQELEIGGSARVITGDLDYVGFAFTTRYALNQDLSFLGELDVFDGGLGLIAGVSLAF